VRPALELAWAVAKEGAEADPPVPPPSAMRPLLRFARRPDRALAVTQRVLDADNSFRERVAEAATERGVGRAGWLFLTRPDGWEQELALLSEATAEGLAAEAEERAERSAVRKLRAAEERADRAEASLSEARRDVARRDEDLTTERRARKAAEQRARSTEADLDQALLRIDELVTRIGAIEASSRSQTGAKRTESPPPPPAEASAPPFDPAPLAAAVASATAAAAELQEALRAAEAALNAVVPAPAPATPAKTPAKPAPRPPRTPRQRQPAALSPAVFEDSVEAAEHLVRVNGMVLLVDGYNASIRCWPDLPIVEQRRRLVDALAELTARSGVDVQVVFDGAEQVEPNMSGQYRAAVRVTFSPPGVEADDVILGLVDTVPIHRPVVVATGDRRVQDEARKRGASVISSDQLLAVIGRAPNKQQPPLH
jgi:predicted RNA-binding protein with PIN domain